MADNAALYAIIRGRVQGVYFRAFTARTAISLGLTGYVGNLPDNSVEITAEGDKNQLLKLVEQLKIGPPGARVDDLVVSWSQFTGIYQDFSVTG
jgi:acylphosphatase